MFTSWQDIKLGARYKDVVSNFEGIATSRTECLTGCDRVLLEGRGDDPKSIWVDVTCVDYINEGVSERFKDVKTNPAVVAGGPSVRSSRATSRS